MLIVVKYMVQDQDINGKWNFVLDGNSPSLDKGGEPAALVFWDKIEVNKFINECAGRYPGRQFRVVTKKETMIYKYSKPVSKEWMPMNPSS